MYVPTLAHCDEAFDTFYEDFLNAIKENHGHLRYVTTSMPKGSKSELVGNISWKFW